MNKAFFAGTIGRDCRLNSVNGSAQDGGVSVANFPLAVTKRQKDDQGKNQTLWVDCSLWGRRAEALAEYLKKGTKVSVVGEADISSYRSERTHEVVPKMTLNVQDITLQGSRQQGRDAPQHQPQQQPQQSQPPQSTPPMMDGFDDDIPF